MSRNPPKPIRVFWSPLSRRMYATRAWREIKPGVIECTGEKFDVTNDVAGIITQHQITFTEAAPIRDAGVPAAIRQLDSGGGWDSETTGGWPNAPTYRALRRAAEMGYVERSSTYGVPCWRLTNEGIQFRRELDNADQEPGR